MVGIPCSTLVGSYFYCGAGLALFANRNRPANTNNPYSTQKTHAQNQRGCAIAPSEQHQTFRNFAPKQQQYTQTSSHPARDLIKDL
jgi:hypothetical protein